MANLYPVGTKFMQGGKVKRESTVIDIETTRNLAGEVVRIEYVAVHNFLGQKVKSRHCHTTVARGLINDQG